MRLKHPKGRTRLGAAVVLVGLAASVNCRERSGHAVGPVDRVHPQVSVRDVRVLLLENVDRIHVRVKGPCVLRTRTAGVLAKHRALSWTELTRASGDFVLGEDRWTSTTFDIVPEPGGTILLSSREGNSWEKPRTYPGFLRCVRSSNTTIDVINVVPLDTYVAGVVASELYADWHRESFRAQAVAARTYAMWQMATNAHRPFDVRASEASQVYRGVPKGQAARKAQEAAAHTRGVVCTWSAPEGERVFCTYYSSACGGLSQPVSNILNVDNIAPLSGDCRCNYCRIAVSRGDIYRWGPVGITKAELTRKLADRYPACRALGQIQRVEVVRRTPAGRLVRLRVVDGKGADEELRAEDFRLTVGGHLMRSTACEIVDTGNELRFVEGHGFGHGVGLCQWGMEGQARLGREAAQILGFYYPGTHLTRAY